jgi:hypothetical protein
MQRHFHLTITYTASRAEQNYSFRDSDERLDFIRFLSERAELDDSSLRFYDTTWSTNPLHGGTPADLPLPL